MRTGKRSSEERVGRATTCHDEAMPRRTDCAGRTAADGIPSVINVTEHCAVCEEGLRSAKTARMPPGPWAMCAAISVLIGMALPALSSAVIGRRVLHSGLAAGLLLSLVACQPKSSPEVMQLQQRLEQQNVKIQQLEQKLNSLSPKGAADPSGKPPAGPVKSLTFRTGTSDDRLRVYWGDGSTTDLPCTKEQATLVCG